MENPDKKNIEKLEKAIKNKKATKDNKLLENINPHSRDKYITFDEEPHIYTVTIDGTEDDSYMSVTTWNHSHFGKFDSDKVIDKMMKGKNWKKSKYYGMSKEEIKEQWKQTGKEASEAGTKMHQDIEDYYNGKKINNNSIEYKFFEEFHKEYIEGKLKPFRTEWMVFDEDLKIAGSVDMIYEREDGNLEIYDWKRSKEIKKKNRWQSGKTTCVEHVPDCNFWHYSLQLSTYKAIIEKRYDKKVVDLYLVCLHPDNNNKSFQRIKACNMTHEVKELFKVREKMLQEERENSENNENVFVLQDNPEPQKLLEKLPEKILTVGKLIELLLEYDTTIPIVINNKWLVKEPEPVFIHGDDIGEEVINIKNIDDFEKDQELIPEEHLGLVLINSSLI